MRDTAVWEPVLRDRPSGATMRVPSFLESSAALRSAQPRRRSPPQIRGSDSGVLENRRRSILENQLLRCGFVVNEADLTYCIFKSGANEF